MASAARLVAAFLMGAAMGGLLYRHVLAGFEPIQTPSCSPIVDSCAKR